MTPELVDHNYRYVRLIGGDIEWFVDYVGMPKPSIVWFDNYGNEIPWARPGRENGKFIATKEENLTRLKIRNLSENSTGFYLVRASNRYKTKQHVFQLVVGGKVDRFNQF